MTWKTIFRSDMRCEKHPDREGRLAIDLPSINLKRYLCEECVSMVREKLSTGGYREQWERELAQGVEDRRVDMLDAYHSEGLKWKR